MNPLVELGISLVEKLVTMVVQIINDSSAHTAEEKAALMATLSLRMNAAASKVAAVTFKDV